jgi:uncharacterized membrane protein
MPTPACPSQRAIPQVSITNNDTTPCFSKAFDLSSTLPDGWATSFSQNSVMVEAGAIVTVSMTKTVPASAPAAIYSVNASATSGTYTATGTASLTVKPGK